MAAAATARSRSTGRPPTSSTSRVGQTVGAFGDGPVANYRVSGIVRFGSEGSIGRQHDLRLRPRDRAAAVRQGRQVRPDPCRRRRRASPTPSCSGRSTRCCRDDAGEDRCRAGGCRQQGDRRMGSTSSSTSCSASAASRCSSAASSSPTRSRSRSRSGCASWPRCGRSAPRGVRCWARSSSSRWSIGLVGSIIGLFLGLGIAVGLTTLLEATGVDLPSNGLVLLEADDRRQHRRRHADRGAREPAPGHSRHADRADRGCPRGRCACPRRASPATRYRPRRSSARWRSRSSPTACSRAASRSRCGSSSLVAGVLLHVRRRGDDRHTSRASAGVRARSTRRSLRRQPPEAWRVRTRSGTRRRTASTAAAVMIGLALITFVAVIGQGFKSLVHGSPSTTLFVGRLLGLGRRHTATSSRTRPPRPSRRHPASRRSPRCAPARPRSAARPSSSPVSTRT